MKRWARSFDFSEAREDAEEAKESEERREEHEEHEQLEETEEHDVTEYTEDISYSAYSDEHVQIVRASEEDDEETETQELEGTLSVKSEEGSRVKKFVVSYETKVLKSPSPAPSSHGKYLNKLVVASIDKTIFTNYYRERKITETRRCVL